MEIPREQIPLEEWLEERGGVVGLVFTDVVDSTRIIFNKETLDYRSMIRDHRERARRLVAQLGGRLIEARGDATFAAFPGAGAGCDYARGLHADTGSDGIAIRAGVHFGPVKSDGDSLVGRSVFVAARVVEHGEGSEVWVSEATRQAFDAEDPKAAAALPWHAPEDCPLKGIPDPIRLWRIA